MSKRKEYSFSIKKSKEKGKNAYEIAQVVVKTLLCVSLIPLGLLGVLLFALLGIFFGLPYTIMITLISFLIGAVLSIILLVTKMKKTDEYIPFGPFIVISTFIAMVVPFSTILSILLIIFSLGTIRI